MRERGDDKKKKKNRARWGKWRATRKVEGRGR